MNEDIKINLKQWAKEYNCVEFIKDDPIQFPHRYTLWQDIEISAFISAWLSYGNRKQILLVCNKIHTIMDEDRGPYHFILTNSYDRYKDDMSCLYRFYKWNDFYMLCSKISEVYNTWGSIEKMVTNDIVENKEFQYLSKLEHCFGHIIGIPSNNNSAAKKLNMFLRWMVRKDCVDFGIWTNISPQELLVPLDTHVHQMALKLGFTQRKQTDIKTVKEITSALAEIFPNDPCYGDFALFGYGINVAD